MDFLVAAGSRSYEVFVIHAKHVLRRGENGQVGGVLTPRTFHLSRRFTDSQKTHPELP